MTEPTPLERLWEALVYDIADLIRTLLFAAVVLTALWEICRLYR